MAVARQGIEREVQGYVELARGFEPQDARFSTTTAAISSSSSPRKTLYHRRTDRRTTFTGTEPELIQRIEAMRDAGWNQIVIPVVPGQESALEDWARVKAAAAIYSPHRDRRDQHAAEHCGQSHCARDGAGRWR